MTSAFEDYQIPTQVKTDDKYNYLDEYVRDYWAENTMREDEAIVFDFNNVCKLETYSVDEKWAEESPLALQAKAKGKIYRRELVGCPRHKEMLHVVSVPPLEHDYLCPKCITDEIYRVLDLRMKRYLEHEAERKAMTKERRHG